MLGLSTTGVKWIDSKAAMLEIGWYEQQLERMSKGKRPNPDYRVWLSLLKYFMEEEHGQSPSAPTR